MCQSYATYLVLQNFRPKFFYLYSADLCEISLFDVNRELFDIREVNMAQKYLATFK